MPNENELIYTGVGSRETPRDVGAIMHALAAALARAGWTLRSGGAPGADSDFEEGARTVPDAAMEIYLAWQGFNDNPSPLFQSRPEAFDIVKAVHPAWEQLSGAARKLHARNVFQVLGFSLDKPAKMTVCWTPDGCESEKTRRRGTGGTGTAIVLSERYKVPVFNLKNEESRVRLNALLTQHGVDYQIPLESGKQFSMF
jgi:hypothetical protein